MTDRDVMCFVNKFRHLLSGGRKAKLQVDCDSGCARVNLEAIFQPSHPPHPHEQHQPSRHVLRRRAGPARHRRRLRRAQAREAAVQADTEQVRPDVSKVPPAELVITLPLQTVELVITLLLQTVELAITLPLQTEELVITHQQLKEEHAIPLHPLPQVTAQ